MERRARSYKLHELTEEQVLEMMDSIETDVEGDEDDYDSDASIKDPDFDPRTHQISSEDERAIDQHIANLDNDTDLFLNAINFSINMTIDDVLPSASTTLHNISLSNEVTDETEPQPSTSTTVPPQPANPKLFRPAKKARSPLPSMENSGPKVIPSAGGFTDGTGIASINKDGKEFANIVWKQKNLQLHVNDVAFQGDCSLPMAIKELETPMQIFCYFFTPEIAKLIAEESRRHALAQDINTTFQIDYVDVYKYIGIMLYMSLYRYPNLESYWSKNAFAPIAKTMPMKRFMDIKMHLSFEDEANRKKKGEPGYDPNFRIRKLASELNDRFDSVPKTSRLCVDEQMCSTKMRHHLRQYMPNKPHKWGVKLFVLCDSTGFAYQFEIYIGAGDNVVLAGQPDLGSTSNVVVRLSQTIPDFKHHILHFDNFYTSIPLLIYLRARGIYSLGTVRVNRIAKCKLPNDAVMTKEQRGYSTEYVGNAYGVDISTVLWKDNKPVRLASTYVGILPFLRKNPENQPTKATRFDRKQKHYIELDCPQIIHEYNRHMGGVDLMDGLMGRYHIRAKTRNMMVRLFYHLTDMTATNSYILYRRIHTEEKNNSSFDEDKEKLMQLPEFREKIASGLVTFIDKRSVGRPTSRPYTPTTPPPESTKLSCNLRIGQKAKQPIDDIRYDGMNHYPKMLPNSEKRFCKLCKKSRTQFFCEKCHLHLCITTAKNCFGDYHRPD